MPSGSGLPMSLRCKARAKEQVIRLPCKTPLLGCSEGPLQLLDEMNGLRLDMGLVGVQWKVAET